MDEKCKYYISSPGRSIKCQGIINGTSIRNIFPGTEEESTKNRTQHFESFCCNQFNSTRCPVYAAIKKAEGAL